MERKELYEFGIFRLDVGEHVLEHLDHSKNGSLPEKAFQTLVLLVRNNGRLLTKKELLDEIWTYSFVEENNLDKCIHAIRQVLGEKPGEQKFIETVRKHGYRFVAGVRRIELPDVGERNEDSPSAHAAPNEMRPEMTRRINESQGVDFRTIESGRKPIENSVDVNSKPEHNLGPRVEPSQKNRTMAFVSVGLLLLATCALAYYLLIVRNTFPARGVRSVAVLPLKNETGNAEIEYLSDGISESLINNLSQLPELKVIARSSSFKYKGEEADPQAVANALGVEAILTGHIAKHGDNILISVELVDTRDRRQVWGGQYQREASDLIAIQAEISQQIADKLRVRLTTSEEEQLAKRETVDPQAYEELLRGRFWASKGGTENGKKAIEHVQKAIAVDPTYALAHALLAEFYGALINDNTLDPKVFRAKAEEAARKAIDLNANLAEAHLAMAHIKTNVWDWTAAEVELKRAIELNPSLSRAHSSYTMFLIIQGRGEEALAEANRARSLDPISTHANMTIVYSLMAAHQNDRAMEAAKKMIELDNDNPDVYTLLGQTYEAMGQYEETVAAYQEAMRLGDQSPDAQIMLGAIYAKAGQPDKTRTILKQLEGGKQYVSPVGFAVLYCALGEREQAFALLEQAYAAHDQQLIWLGVEGSGEGVFAPLTSDPRLADLMRRVGLPHQTVIL